MKTKKRSCKPASIANIRWAAYAAAGAATALVGSNSAEAAIHYSGRLDVVFPRNENTTKTFQLDQPGDSIVFYHHLGLSTFPAGFGINGKFAGSWRGIALGSNIYYASKLSFGQRISAGHFVRGFYYGVMARNGGPSAQWNDPGRGFVGFRFNSGGGIQYGWARVRMGGVQNNNCFKLIDYAYADPGEPITAGQRSSDEQAPDQGSTDEQGPDEGSLGWLALGGAGVLAWRKRRLRHNHR